MSDLLLGVALAVAASSCFNLAVVVQAREARAVPRAHAMRLSLLGQLLRRRRWLAGLALGAIAVPLQTVALMLAPITVVQPADAVGLVVLLVAGVRMLGEPVGRRELLAVGAIVLGVLGVSLAGVEHEDTHAGAATLALTLGPLALVALAPYALRRRRLPGLVMVLSAGVAFALGAFALKLIADSLNAGAWGALVLWGAFAAAFAVLGVTGEMSALQRRTVASVAPIIFALELAIPVLLGPIAGGEPWPSDPADIVLIVAALALTVGGAAALMRSGPVVGMLEAEHAAAHTAEAVAA